MTVYVQETWASLGLGERLSDTINYQDLMRVNTQDLQIVEINKDLIESENNILLLTNCEVHTAKYSDRSFEVRTE